MWSDGAIVAHSHCGDIQKQNNTYFKIFTGDKVARREDEC